MRSDRQTALLAVAICLVAIIGFDIMGILVRMLIARGFSAPELSAYRNVLGIFPSLIVLIWMGELKLRGGSMIIVQWKLAFFRGLTVAAAQLCYYTALGMLELATVSALAQTNALFVVLISVVLMGERIGPWRIAALALGFVGALWILRPGSDSFSPAALLPIVASACYAFSIVSVRFFEAGISNALLYLYASVASMIGAFVIAIFTTGFTPLQEIEAIEALMIFTLSMAGGTAVLLLMLAYRMASPSLLAPFTYLSILTAFGFGWLVFGELPIDTLFPGVVLILGAGALVLWRENAVKT